MGRMAGRQTEEDFFFLKREKKAQGLVEAVILRSPTCQVQAANEEAEGGRADEGLERSEKSAACLPQEKNRNVLRPYFQICTNTFSKRKKGEEDGKG